ncbi:hypothetical protein IPM62_03940 [Candidatus Woesebacteria bacterium]|nr:MAG: hypothetical protein IPM62_03940 [Candidatus Woesebacteria bacterium]
MSKEGTPALDLMLKIDAGAGAFALYSNFNRGMGTVSAELAIANVAINAVVLGLVLYAHKNKFSSDKELNKAGLSTMLSLMVVGINVLAGNINI